MIVVGNIEVSLGVEYDTKTGKLIVKSIEQDFIPKEKERLIAQRVINETEKTYKIFTFGSTAAFADVLPQGEMIDISIKDDVHKGKVHRTSRGRIDSLASVFNNYPISVGTVIEATYTPETRTLSVEIL